MATTDAPPRLLTVPQVAAELGLSKRTVRRRIADGELPAVKLGSGPNAPVRIDRGELAEWLASHRTLKA